MEVNKRLRVLVSAYACSPYKGSEPGVGWGYVKALSEYHDLWVIVEEEKCREDIERYLEENSQFASSVHFIFVRKQRNRLLRKIWPPSYYWYYRQWHREVLKLAQQLQQDLSFDLVHQLTMVGFREPGYLWKLDAPFVWGPVGGMGLFPWRFLPVVGVYGACYYLGYNLYNLAQMRLLRRPKKAAIKAGRGLILATPENASGAIKYWGVQGEVIPEIGLPEAPAVEFSKRCEGEPLRIVWTGLHIPRKALNLALLALSRLPESTNWELHVLGKGEQTEKWMRLSKTLGIGSHCTFHGWMPREDALQVMKSAHVMLITSLRDLTSTVTVESLALGLPVVTLDHCGFSSVVDQSCGLKIPVTSPREVMQAVSEALGSLEQDEGKRRSLASGALLRASNFAWEGKAAQVDAIYRAKLKEVNQARDYGC
ncbi:glycosyltransferase family 4 protein [Halioglobus sp. Uisw_031]|uniref:glycosyltransferase family 4 protein n=1 Tax=Halioglobus sp. Uisw_031 TaxID=3230977 RepID=UPI0039E8263B